MGRLFLYELRLALLGLRRDPYLAVAMFVCLALGGGLWTMAAGQQLQEQGAGAPLPADLHQVELPHPRALALGRALRVEVSNYNARTRVTFPEYETLAGSGLAVAQAGTYRARVLAGAPGAAPALDNARFVSADFFTLFSVAAGEGRVLTRDDDRSGEAVVVLGRRFAEALRARTGAPAQGARVLIEGRPFRVIGVLAQDQPNRPPWDLTFAESDQDQMYLPLAWGRRLKAWPDRVVFQSPASDNVEHLLASDAVFVAFWIQLPTSKARADYAAYLRERFGDKATLRARDAWLTAFAYPRSNTWIFTFLLALALFSAGSNSTRLLLARGAKRRDQVGIHRALGATRRSVFTAQLLEAGVIALAAALTGAGIGAGYNLIYNQVALESDIPVPFTAAVLAYGFLPSFAVGLAAALYPAWRLARTAPTIHLGRA